MTKSLIHVVNLDVALPVKKVIELAVMMAKEPHNLRLGYDVELVKAEIVSIHGEDNVLFDQAQMPREMLPRKSGEYQMYTGQTAHLAVRICTEDWRLEVLTGLKQVRSVKLRFEFRLIAA